MAEAAAAAAGKAEVEEGRAAAAAWAAAIKRFLGMGACAASALDMSRTPVDETMAELGRICCWRCAT